MKNYLITIVLTDGNTIKRTIAMKPRRLRKALRQAVKGSNVLFGGAEEVYVIFSGQVSRVLATQEK